MSSPRGAGGGPPSPPDAPGESSPAPPAGEVRVGPVVPDALALIGGTPLVRLARISPEGGGVIYGKLESMNPGGSVKDRAALGMVLCAERDGALRPGSTIVEATSGNTGISLAMIAAVRGYRCVVVMPEDMSVERRHILRAYGAEIVLTPEGQGMAGAVARAIEICEATPGAWTSRQFHNPANPGAHARATGLEILAQTGGDIAAFVAGVGTGGTLTGCGRVLRDRLGRAVRICAVEPTKSAVLSGRGPGPHGIQGLGAGFVPAILERSLIDEILTVTEASATRMVRRLAREEGLLVGPSSGASVHAAVEIARKVQGTIVTVLPDSGERYLL
ncbi:cysteine synthase [Sorangium cellulosum]|uniref:Cysteine synthase n=1 Tax=Sorangium cellulosum TaxID=56 RepID=A0A2L0EYX1_SORCE|nr:cysteine synthase A [Sorangium cellulosum]AUX44492.1 cysteine synthase [Sorangium cellulosum]